MVELSDATYRWIADNDKADTTKLRLKHHGNPEMELAITQIECRRKTSVKLADTLRCERFLFPNLLSAEQATSDRLAEFHASLIEPGSSVLDMTCGLGIDAFHCARRAASVTAIDLNPEVAEAMSHNAGALGISNIQTLCADSTQWIAETRRRFDTIFIDPARRGSNGERVFALSQCRPDVVGLLPQMAGIARRAIIKASPMLDVSRTVAELRCVEAVYLIGTPTECKELTAVIDFNLPDNHRPTIHAVTVGHPTVTFTTAEESATKVEPQMPAKGMVLYEPFPSVLKSGAFSIFAHRYSLSPLHHHTHLYLSDKIDEGVPARCYRILEALPFSRQGIRELGELRQANTSVRNFIITAPQLSKKLKLRDGGPFHLFGVKAANDTYMMLLLSPLSNNQ
ncbi:MAG: methyltransferase domain-containing protein [Bacteroides sp.]|nr:methyltransferase domain-containing protein [Bacteroides sp.]MBD5375755.1 methyltransferase domain-containing protein [Bacteroides sp.]